MSQSFCDTAFGLQQVTSWGGNMIRGDDGLFARRARLEFVLGAFVVLPIDELARLLAEGVRLGALRRRQQLQLFEREEERGEVRSDEAQHDASVLGDRPRAASDRGSGTTSRAA